MHKTFQNGEHFCANKEEQKRVPLTNDFFFNHEYSCYCVLQASRFNIYSKNIKF